MARCIFIHDPENDRAIVYPTQSVETGKRTGPGSYFFSNRPTYPFKHDVYVLDRAKHIYRIVFTNVNNDSWYIDLENNNNGCERIKIEEGKVYLIVGCADFFPEKDHPDYSKGLRERIDFIESLSAEKNEPEENNEK